MNVVPELIAHERAYYKPAYNQRRDLILTLIALRRRWPLVAASLLICLGLAIAYLMVTPPVFTSTAVLVTDTKQTPPTPSQISSELLIDPAVIESQIEMVRSLEIAGDVVDRLKLENDPEFVGGAPRLLSRLLSFGTRPPEDQPSEQKRRIIAANSVVQKTKVTRIGHSYLVEIAVTSSTPDKSADIANAIADAYIRDQLDGRLLANQRMTAWMKTRVEQVRRQSDAAALHVEFYRRQIAASNDTNGKSSAQKGSGSSADPASPDTNAAANSAKDITAAQLRVLIEKADAERADFDALQNRFSRVTQFMQQQSLPVTEARLLTSAEPPLTKSAPKTSVIMMLASVGGLVVGIALAFGRESLDHRVRWPSQVRDIGLPFAGFLPLRKRPTASAASQAKSLESVAHDVWATLFDARRPWCAATQTLRRLKLAVDQSSHRTMGVVVGIVSAWPGEGKSTLSFNFAQLLAETGSQVLVVDADFTSPALSKSLAPDAECGLAELIEQAPIEDCVSVTALGFDLLSCSTGVVPMHPFHLLAGQSMLGALTAARHHYQYVVIDLPALLTSVDSQAIATLVDAFVFVTDFGRTTSDDVEQALSTSEALANRVVATVINKSRMVDRNGRRALRHVATA